MLKKDLVEKNPLRVFHRDANGNDVTTRMGLLMARAGLGKTAILVQIALESIFRGNQVLHVSIGQSLDKTRTWYDDIFKVLVEETKLEKSFEIRDDIVRNRLIMTFKESEFNRPKLEERLNDLVYQNIFRPNCLVIDGFDFENTDRQTLTEIRELAEAMDLQIWFSAVCHRDDHRVGDDGVPAPCHEVGSLFDTVVMLKPDIDKSRLSLNVVKDSTGCIQKGKVLYLDPVTNLVKEA
ncbi:MAG: hypothetical protein KKB30_16865 [Proteobacteria bacterium]|nr:hypothetical protein [Pseudomonadota bacterium]MBU1716043.1 hypothetical protein [Pseudomonadota bacterium]